MILIAKQIDLPYDSFYRVDIIDDVVTTRIMSIETAHRILPKLLDSWGVPEGDRAGMFTGAVIRKPTFAGGEIR